MALEQERLEFDFSALVLATLFLFFLAMLDPVYPSLPYQS